MANIESAFIDLGYLDTLAARDSAIHRLDPRVKVLTTVLFVICIVSYDKYVLSAMLPFVLFLTLVMGLGGIPAHFILKKLVLVSPFAILLGMFNPFFDQQPLVSSRPHRDIRWLAIVSFHSAALLPDRRRHAAPDCHYRFQCRLHGSGKDGHAQNLRGSVAAALPLYFRADG